MRKIILALLLLGLCVPAFGQNPWLRYEDLLDLRAKAQATPDMTLIVASGEVYVVGALVSYAGGNSPSFTAPGSNNRIDILTINASGTLAVTQGVAGASPTAPTAPTGTMPICTVYLKSTSTSIQAYDTSTATHGYILADVRPFIKRDWITSLGTVDIQPTLTATDSIVYIQNQGPLGANDYLRHIDINGDNLDPSGVEAEIDGVDVDFTGVSTTSDPLLIAFEAKMPRWFDKAVYITQGQIFHDFTPSTNALAQHDSYSVIVDASAQDATSMTHAVDVALASTLSGSVAAIGTHVGVMPIMQHIGTLTSFGANYAGRWTSGPTYTDNIDGEDIWVANGDSILVGHTATFDEIDLVFTLAATKDVFLRFYYYEDGVGWTRFYPADDTNGGRQDGLVRFSGLTLTDWQADYDPGAGADEGYWIRIERNRVNDPGTVTLATAKYLVATTFQWDASGDLSVRSIYLDAGAGGGGTDVDLHDIATGILALGTTGSGTDHHFRLYNRGVNYIQFSTGSVTAGLSTQGQNLTMITNTGFFLMRAGDNQAGQHIYFDLGGLLYIRDEDDGGRATRLTIDSATGDIIPGADSFTDLGNSTHYFKDGWIDDLTVSTSLDVGSDTDVAVTLGKAVIGYNESLADYATFRHIDHATVNYALLQAPDGHVALNAPTGQYLSFRIANAEIAQFNATGLQMDGDLLVDGGEIGLTADTDLLGLAANTLTVNATSAEALLTVNAITNGQAASLFLQEQGSANFGFRLQYDSDNFKILRHDNNASGVVALTIARATGDATFAAVVDTAEHYEVDGTQVVTNQGAAIADVSAPPDPSSSDANAVVINLILARMRAHGLIAAP